jgi:hypothetical protein
MLRPNYFLVWLRLPLLRPAPQISFFGPVKGPAALVAH